MGLADTITILTNIHLRQRLLLMANTTMVDTASTMLRNSPLLKMRRRYINQDLAGSSRRTISVSILLVKMRYMYLK